jgi:RimJ/RimL family protein N-acetyltransferase
MTRDGDHPLETPRFPRGATADASPLDAEALVRSVPTRGVLVRGIAVELGWPEGDELDRITELRNQPRTLPWFLDRRPLDPETNREFLSRGVDRPYGSILAIRRLDDGSFLGSIGWMDWQPAARRAALGRLMVDHRAVLHTGSRFPDRYPGVAVDAARALGRFAVSVMKIRFITYCYLEDNRRARRVAEAGGLRVLRRDVETTQDGRRLVTVETEILPAFDALDAPPSHL